MRKILLMLLLLLILGSVLTAKQNTEQQDNVLNWDNINDNFHTEQYKKNNHYIENLNVVELFEFAYEMILKDDDKFESNGMILINPIKKILRKEDHAEFFVKLLKNSEYEPKFLAFVIDIASKEVKDDNSYFDALQQVLLDIASDQKSKVELRRYAILHINSQDEKYQEAFSTLMEQVKTKKLTGAVITKMRRNKHPKLQEYLFPILMNHQDYDRKILHPAIMAADSRYISTLGKIARETKISDTYDNCLNQLGWLNQPKAVIECIQIPKRFLDDESMELFFKVNNYLWNSQTAIEYMLQEGTSDEYKINALKAIRIGRMPFGEEIVKLVQKLQTTRINADFKKECQLTVDLLNNLQLSDRSDYNYNKNKKMFDERYRQEFRGEK
ncbi:MAG: hypothetical protein KAS49_05075 [Candidatus Cloacimonetes bacterium]|nr:hypothetical protein [Candidatus Cloacimonadota bacterium]